MSFTSRPGAVNAQPANIVPGGGLFIPIRTVTVGDATLTFSGNMTSSLIGHLIYTGVVTVITQLRKLVSAVSRPAVVVQSRFLVLQVVQRTTTQLDSVPTSLDIAVTETFPYQVDVTNYLAQGDSISSIAAVLTLASSGAVVTAAWQGSISTAGNIIQVPINAPVLQLGQEYQLATTFTASSGKRLTVLSTINVIA